LPAILLALLLSNAQALSAYEWPATGAVLVVGFGQQDGERYGTGVALVSPRTEVRPIAGGEVVFWYDPARRRGSLPRTLGAHLVVEHAERVRSVYSHLEPGSVSTTRAVGPDTIVGRIGGSGLAKGSALGLTIVDMETASYLNPLVVMPPLPDRQAPVIARVLLRRGDVTVELGRAGSAVAGPAELIVEAFDLREDVGYRWRIAPYTVSLAMNGRQTAAITFDTLHARGELLLEGASRKPAPSVYAGPWLYRLGEHQLQRGETRFVVFVRDYAGNESTRELVLSIGG
jgi:hypothetical protein